jgi:hypothetical protein
MSDADGRFELKRLGANVSASLQIEAEGYAAGNTFFDPKKDTAKWKEFVLHPAGAIRGKIVAQGGGAVPGTWWVYAQSPAATSSNAKAAPDGSFYIQGVKEGAYTLVVNPENAGTLRWVCPNPPNVDVVAGQTATVEVVAAEVK